MASTSLPDMKDIFYLLSAENPAGQEVINGREEIESSDRGRGVKEDKVWGQSDTAENDNGHAATDLYY